MSGFANWQAKISIDIDDLKKRIKDAENELDSISKKEHKVKLDLDTKTLENTIQKLDRILDSVGKGTDNFKQFENLSQQLSSIISDIKNISNAFSSMNNGSEFVANINSITTSLNTLSTHFVSEMSNKISSSIKDVKSDLSDIGDGDELSPLLQMIDRIELAINELSTSIKGIGLNMNIDVGSDTELEAKIQAKMSNALQAYQRLFEHIKMSGVGGSMVNTNFFEFDINQYDTMMAKIQAYRKFIENMRNETKSQFNGKDILYSQTDKKYWTQAAAAMGQLTRAQNELNQASDTNPLSDLFGSSTDLSGVIEQLTVIVSKLDEISASANKFADTFKEGFNVTTSVEEIDKLTNRVKELEDELAKVNAVSPIGVESNISSEMKDVIPQVDKVAASSDSVTNAIKEENNALEQNTQKAKENADAKKKLTDADKEVSNVNLSKYDTRLESYNKKTSGYDATIERFENGGWTSDTYKKRVDAVKEAVKQYEAILNNLKNHPELVSDEELGKLDKQEKLIKENITAVQNMSAAQKGYSLLAGQKALDKINSLVKENSNMSRAAKNQIKAWYDEIASGNPRKNLTEILGEVQKIVNAEIAAGRGGKSMIDAIKEKAWYGVASTLGTYLGVNDIFRYVGQGVQTVRELDTALTEMRKVSDESTQSLKNYQATTFDVADAVGTTAKQIQNSTADWMRLGRL